MKTRIVFASTFIMLALMAGNANAQVKPKLQPRCYTPEFSANTADENAFNEYVVRFKEEGGDRNRDLKTIPLVIHVIYRNRADSLLITWARIQSQLMATNQEMRRQNESAKNTRPIFKPVAADCDIQVCLATKKPDRSAFNGVIYHKYPNYNQGTDYNAMVAATQLDPAKYLNVWVIPGIDGGSAIFPWQGSASLDGFWVGSQWFGTIGSDLSDIMDEGSTFSHELAHYLGVYHTFHNSSAYLGQCKLEHSPIVGDLCGDTPLDWYWPLGVIACDEGERFCEDGGEPFFAQVENYMFYAYDKCTNMFSRDQRARMRACLQGLRHNLSTPANLAFTGTECGKQPDKPCQDRKIAVYPNPTFGILHFVYDDQPFDAITIKVYNSMGKKMKEAHSDKPIRQMDLGDLQEGIYYLRITIDNTLITKYIIKK